MSVDGDDPTLTVVAPPTKDERPPEDRVPPSTGAKVAERYEISRRIGKGGMGEVMSARDGQVGRDVAIKRMKAASPSERAIARFLREATIQGRLEHPAIVPVHEIGRDADGLPFFVMKKLTGTNLARILDSSEKSRFPLERILRAFVDVCLAVEFAHVRGIVHRDLKPDNIVLGDFGEVYVIDWGVAKVVGEDESDFADVGSGSGEYATAVGTAIGTPGYMAPEQARGMSDVDGRADIYTLGCVLFEILAGEPLHPRGRDGLASAVFGTDARPSVRSPERKVPPELDALCVEATAYERTSRIATARELGDRVQRYLDGDRDLAKRRELAEAHLDRARASFAAGDDEDNRRAAMREAAAALALAPEIEGAAELVGRLMLEPPRTMPREVESALVTDDYNTARVYAQSGIWALVAALTFSPLLLWLGDFSPYVVAFDTILVLNGILCIHAFKARIPRPGLIVIGNVLFVALLARMFSPLLIAPGVAAVLSLAMVLTPRFSPLGSASVIACLLIAAIFTPLALERFGVLPTTITMSAHGVIMDAPAFAGREVATIGVGCLYTVGLIVGACVMGDVMRTRARDAHRHLLLQAWQLRQLVPR
jgi:eukaryotic-like serine/threonine-protein kinase